MERDDPAYRGQSDYTRLLLDLYDPLVLGPIARFTWRWPTTVLVERYRRHVPGRPRGPLAVPSPRLARARASLSSRRPTQSSAQNVSA